MFAQLFLRMAKTAHQDALRVHASERLRRAGYCDGERIPRQQRHWSNR
jgi:hypothetical protein